MGIELRYEGGRSTKKRTFQEADDFVFAENGPFVKIRNWNLEQSTVFAIHEDRVITITQV